MPDLSVRVAEAISKRREELDERERLAKAATPGPWTRFTNSDDQTFITTDAIGVKGVDRSENMLLDVEVFSYRNNHVAEMERQEADAAFICATDPLVGLAAVARERAYLDGYATIAELHQQVITEGMGDCYGTPFREIYGWCAACDAEMFPCATLLAVASALGVAVNEEENADG